MNPEPDGKLRGRRGSGRPWANAVLESYYECASNDPKALQVWCYTDRLSYAPGDRIAFQVCTTAETYALEIIRDGARPETVFRREDLPGSFHPTPENCSVRGCGWPAAFEVEVPTQWPSGGYIVRTTAAAGDRTIDHDHLFVVRRAEAATPAPILLVAATCTWTAYNDWGGSNHYEGITGPEGNQYSPVLSIRRPLSRGFCWLPAGAPRAVPERPPAPGTAPRYPHMEWSYANGYSKKYASAGWASYERHFVRWAEANGYTFDLATQHDLESCLGLLDRYRCVVFVGHDEYWSWPMRDAVDRYLDGGGRVARFAGNFLWQIRLDDEGTTQVCFKYRADAEDPYRDGDARHLLTSCWESAAVNRPGALTFGLNASRGIYAGWGAMAVRGPGGFTVYRPEHWALAGADLHFGDVLGAEGRVFGYEVDGLDYGMRDGLPFPTGTDGAPNGIEILALGLATLVEEDHGHRGTTLFVGDDDLRFVARAVHGDERPETLERIRRGSGMMVTYRRGRGEVFHAGTCDWVAGLTRGDPQVAQVTRTVLDRYTAG